jgi:tRNA(Arg) A34 adenosine deaminase TadA
VAGQQRSGSGSAEEYFALLLDRARHAGERGNYAIAAALVVREPEGELVVLGENTLFAGRDPAGHAEMNAIRAAQRLTAAPPAAREALVAEGERDGWLRFREDRGGEPESVLYATLEPCPMCTVCIINAGIDRAVVAVADPPSGTLEGGRLTRLPPIWETLAEHLEVVWAQSEDAGDRTSYLPRELREALLDAFMESRDLLDRHLAGGGALDRDALREVIREHVIGAPE